MIQKRFYAMLRITNLMKAERNIRHIYNYASGNANGDRLNARIF